MHPPPMITASAVRFTRPAHLEEEVHGSDDHRRAEERNLVPRRFELRGAQPVDQPIEPDDTRHQSAKPGGHHHQEDYDGPSENDAEPGSGFRVQGSGFVPGSGFWVLGSRGARFATPSA